MKISIITASYNSAQTILCTLKSVSDQTYNAIEHIIIDGASKDNTVDICTNYNSNLIILSEKDKGIYDAMNKGIMMASGEVIGILNSDDMYLDGKVINDIMECFKNDPELDIVYGNLQYVNRLDINKVVRKWTSLPYYPRFFENGNVPPHPALFVKNRVYKEAGLFNLDYKLAADYEFMLRIFKKHNFKSLYINRLIIKMRLGGATNKSIANIINGNKEIIRAWKNNGLKVPFTLMPLKMLKRFFQFI